MDIGNMLDVSKRLLMGLQVIHIEAVAVTVPSWTIVPVIFENHNCEIVPNYPHRKICYKLLLSRTNMKRNDQKSMNLKRPLFKNKTNFLNTERFWLME